MLPTRKKKLIKIYNRKLSFQFSRNFSLITPFLSLFPFIQIIKDLVIKHLFTKSTLEAKGHVLAQTKVLSIFIWDL